MPPTLPLLIGRDDSPATPVAPGTRIRTVRVVDEAIERDGLLVQRSNCGCSERSCGEWAYLDTRFINDASNFEREECPFRGRAFFPPFETLMAVLRRLKISSQAEYLTAQNRGKLPKCSPRDPSEYAEWTKWGEFIGKKDYHSDAELYDALDTLQLVDLDLLPAPERRRILLALGCWNSIKDKAAELGIPENQIHYRINEIAAALAPPDKEAVSGNGTGRGTSSRGTKVREPRPLTLGEEAEATVKKVTVWLPESEEMRKEILNGFFHDVWHQIDKLDTLSGVVDTGYAHVYESILTPLNEKNPDLAQQFQIQYDEVQKHRINGRNWMQAYNVWYSQKRRRRFINSSSAGLGKTRTVPAIVWAHDIRFSVFFSPKKITNKDNPQLAQEMLSEDPMAKIHFSDDGVPDKLEEGYHHYWVCNSEKLQFGEKSREMIDALMRHRPGFVVFDEGHLLVSSNLVEPDKDGEDPKYKPRMDGLRYLLDGLSPETRILVLTGTPVRVNAREGEALFELIGEDVGNFTSEMSELNALRLRGRLQEFGFQFSNHRLPELRRFVYPFKVPQDVANKLNAPGMSTMERERIRIKHVLEELKAMSGKIVLNAEQVALSPDEAVACSDKNEIEKELGASMMGLSLNRFPAVRLAYDPLKQAVNPVFFSYFIGITAEEKAERRRAKAAKKAAKAAIKLEAEQAKATAKGDIAPLPGGNADGEKVEVEPELPDEEEAGIVRIIADFLTEKALKYRRCTGDSDDAELGDYLRARDSCLIASAAWSVGVDGSQKCSDTLVTLGIPWHDAGHRQMVARLHRQGATRPDGTPTTVVHEIIPVALNVDYDVKRLNNVYTRRTFTQVLSLGEVDDPANDTAADVKKAVDTLKLHQ